MDDDYNDDMKTHKHDGHSTCCGCQSVFTSSQDDITSELFDIGETRFFTNYGWSGLVKVIFFLWTKNILRIIVTNSNGDDIITTKEHLRSPIKPDVGWIPILVPKYKNQPRLSQKKILKNHVSQTFVTVAAGFF